MTTQHTQGRLKVQHPHAGERGWEVAFEPGLEQICQNVTEKNARRLVAAWNACEGISTEALERLGTLDRARVKLDVLRTLTVAQHEAIKQLREALRMSAAALEVRSAFGDADLANVTLEATKDFVKWHPTKPLSLQIKQASHS